MGRRLTSTNSWSSRWFDRGLPGLRAGSAARWWKDRGGRLALRSVRQGFDQKGLRARMAESEAETTNSSVREVCKERLHEHVSTTDTMHREVPEGIAENAFRPSLLMILHSYEKGNPKML